MDKLDDAVVEHLERRLLQPDRLRMLMGNVLVRRQEWVERRRSHAAELRKRSAEAANKLVRLYATIEDSLVGPGAPKAWPTVSGSWRPPSTSWGR